MSLFKREGNIALLLGSQMSLFLSSHNLSSDYLSSFLFLEDVKMIILMLKDEILMRY